MSIALAALVLLAPVSVRATTYVVDPAGSDAGDGSALQPWEHIQRAAAVQPGDVVLVHAGRYAESVHLATSGTADAPIEYRADPGAVLESPDPAASLSAFDFAPGVGHVVLDGFTARGGFHETLMLRGGVHDVTLRNCERYGKRVGIWIAGATTVTVERCSIHDNTGPGLRIADASRAVTVRDTASTGNDDGLGCNGAADGFSVAETSADVTFAGCRAQGNSDDGFDVQADGALLSAVESRDNHCTGVKLWQNARLENALVVGNTTGVGTSSFFAAPIAIEVINSTIADNTGTQMVLGSASASTAYTVTLRNDIAAGAGKAVEVEWPVVLLEDHDLLFRPDTTSAVIVRHLADGAERLYSGQEVDAGIWAAESGQGAGTLAIDPGFIDPTYRVAPDSAAVDRGAATDAPLTDRSGTMRPLGNAVDIGPDEHDGAVVNHPPWADPGPDRIVIVGRRLRVQAFGSVDPDGDALTYAWDFGDGGSSASGYTAQHVYMGAGDYRLALTVSDGLLTQTRAVVVHVSDSPPPTPTMTPTPGGGPGHDSQIRIVPRRLRVRLARGTAGMVKWISVAVRNADLDPLPEVPGHLIRVTIDPGDCPPFIIGGPATFMRSGVDIQTGMVVAGGSQERARVALVLDSAFFQTPDRGMPFRCHMRFTAVGPDTDPTPANNVADLTLELFDENEF